MRINARINLEFYSTKMLLYVNYTTKGNTKLSKEAVLLKDIISRYHPTFVRSNDLKQAAIKHPEYFNVCRLVEESLAAASGGKYKFIDGAHADFDDDSDSKTASISVSNGRGEIGNVVSAGGNSKVGPLRCIIYNPYRQSLLYYFLPKDFWKYHVDYHPTTNFGKIRFSYNRGNDEIFKFQPYRCHDFKHLAQC